MKKVNSKGVGDKRSSSQNFETPNEEDTLTGNRPTKNKPTTNKL